MNDFSSIPDNNEMRDLARVTPEEGMPYVEAWFRECPKGTAIAPAMPNPFKLTPADCAPNPFHHASDEPDEPCDCFTCFGSGKTKGTLIDCPDCDGSGLVI